LKKTPEWVILLLINRIVNKELTTKNKPNGCEVKMKKKGERSKGKTRITGIGITKTH